MDNYEIQQKRTDHNRLSVETNRSGSFIEDNRPRSITRLLSSPQIDTRHKVMQLRAGFYLADNRVVQKKENKTGLPDKLKSGVENLSGHSLDDVKVHYSSALPGQLQALAFAQGNQIHLAPGQEKHLPHEAWHIAQQKQGRVRSTVQMKQGMMINNDGRLEKEADIMGAKSLAAQPDESPAVISKMIQRKKARRPNGYTSLVSHTPAANNKIYQFAMPPEKWNTLFYTAEPKAITEAYTSGRPTQFSTKFKKNLIKKWVDEDRFSLISSGMGNKEYIRTVSTKSDFFANWVPIEAFQIDHKVPWEVISKDMFTYATNLKEFGGTVPEVVIASESGAEKPVEQKRAPKPSTAAHRESKVIPEIENEFKSGSENSVEQKPAPKPNIFAARMYYHDFDNLQPMQGSENAGKGANIAATSDDKTTPIDALKAFPKDQADVEKFITEMYLTIMDSVQNGYAHTKSGDEARENLNAYWNTDGEGWKHLKEAATGTKSSVMKVAHGTPKKVTVGKYPQLQPTTLDLALSPKKTNKKGEEPLTKKQKTI